MNRKDIVNEYNIICRNYYGDYDLNNESEENMNDYIKLVSIADYSTVLKETQTMEQLVESIYYNFLNIEHIDDGRYTKFYHANFFNLFGSLAMPVVEKYYNKYNRVYDQINYDNVVDFLEEEKISDDLKNVFDYCEKNYLSMDEIFDAKFKILSFNTSSDAMSGQNEKNFICKNQKENNTCLNNLNKFLTSFIIKRGSLDFICLQEAEGSDEVHRNIENKFPQEFKRVSIEQNNELMTTFYNNRFTLDRNDGMVSGNTGEGEVEPFLALFFNGWLCVINVHFVSGYVFYVDKLFNTIRSISKKCYEKLGKYQIIIAGDFNNNLKAKNSLSNNIDQIFTGKTSLNPKNNGIVTCCDQRNGLYGDNLKNKIWYNEHNITDHILVSTNQLLADYEYQGAEIIDPRLMISNHAPIYAEFYGKNNYGYILN